MATLKTQLGSRVKEIRKKHKLTQARLAEKVHLSTNMIGYIERGERFPSPETFEKLATALEVSVQEFFCFPPVNCEEDPERKAVIKELHDLLKDTPTAYIRSVAEIVAASLKLEQKK